MSLRDWLCHIEEQEKNCKEGISYEEYLSSDDEEGMSALVIFLLTNS